MKTKHANATESNRNLYITVLMERYAKRIALRKSELEDLRKRLEQKTDVELLLMVQVGRERQGA